ncbi:GDP/GTP exchange factor [Hypoxylon rubiginosum]|uniref:GDP/GTP exchange factor n=1 Tax=Hypoxylon rubiginosum TaxID=110542 RepID=A0ACB9YU85_9PEZI|nr:GDP/GTP exchange factor [Hypoxylon rubiginosum]
MPPKARKNAVLVDAESDTSSGTTKDTRNGAATNIRQSKSIPGAVPASGKKARPRARRPRPKETEQERLEREQEEILDQERHMRMSREDELLDLIAARQRPGKRNVTKRKRDEDDQVEKPAEKPRAKKQRGSPKDATQDEAPKKASAPRMKRVVKAASKKDAAQGQAPKNAPVPKKTRTVKAAPKKSAERSVSRSRGLGARTVIINQVPSAVFDVFVFGEGSSGELGLGSKKYDGKKPIDVKRPRINHNLRGVVAIACGGMHCIALTSDQTVLTWGVNDDKALGRDTLWEGGIRDIEEEEDSEMDDEDTGINPNESTPGEVDLSVLPEGTQISQVVATDSASFILTDDGWVYGWGTFRGSDGIIGFSEGVRTQPTPTIIPDLKNIVHLACGSNHVLAMDASGKVFTWGSGGQFQLGRKPLSRLGGPSAGLSPQACGKFTKKHRAVLVGAGSYHSFYVDTDGRVWAWGLNNYAQTGLNDNTGEDDAMVLQPQMVKSLEDYKVCQIVGGEHHSVACTTDGKLLTWGRVDGHQVGQPSTLYTEENAIFDDNGKPRILAQPTVIDGIKAQFIAAGTDTSFALDEAGKVYSWGFSANYQTGQGTIDDIEVPTMIDNTAIRDRHIIWAGAGGQFSMIAAAADDELPNGH